MIIIFTLCLSFLLSCGIQNSQNGNEKSENMTVITLPDPVTDGDTSIEKSLLERRSIREYSDTPLSIDEIGQLAWAAQGITDDLREFRTAPSAGATFPIEISFILTNVADTDDGVYRYDNRRHSLEKIIDKDLRRDVYRAALMQDPVVEAPVVMIISGVPERTEQRYGDRARRYMYMEAGHVAQNVYLQGVALEIGTVVIGAFDDRRVGEVMQFGEGEHPLYIMPLGRAD